MPRIRTPYGEGDLPAVKPLISVDNVPLAVSAVAATTISTIGSNAVWLYATTPTHINITTTGAVATVNHAPIPSNVPIICYCQTSDFVSAIKMAGQQDGSLWVCPCKSID